MNATQIKPGKRIVSITVKREVDTDADLLTYGKYTSDPSGAYTIDREERGDMRSRHEYRYFKPNADNYSDCTEDEIRKYCEQDYRRAEDYNNQEWCYLDVSAEAKVVFRQEAYGCIEQTILGGDRWGIESDSADCDFKEAEDDALAELVDELLACGFSQAEIDAACKEVKRSGP